MINQKLIEKVKQVKTSLNEISVYNLDVYTSLELYYELAKKINEVISELISFEGCVVNEIEEFEKTINDGIINFENLVTEDLKKQNETIQNMLDNDLKLEVGLKIDELIKNGDIQDLINNKLFSDLNLKIDESKRQYNLSNGVIKLPNTFPKLPFDVVYKNNKFIANIKPNDIIDFKNADIVYIDGLNTNVSSGLDIKTPISFNRLSENIKNNVYTKDNIIVNFLNDFECPTDIFSLTNQGKNIYFRSMSPRGVTWVGRMQRPNTPNKNECSGGWVSFDNIYKIVQDKYYNVVDVINPVNEFNEMICYVKVDSLSKCLSTKGTYYQENTVVYLNPLNNENISKCFLVLSQNIFEINGETKNTLIFENLCFPMYSYRQYPSTTLFETYFFNCLWHRNPNDAIAFQGAYKTYLINCVASYGNKDGFNYHTTDINSLAVEVNCVAYGSGVNKTSTGNTSTHSNNGSTAHDGMKVARFGGEYYNCQGPIIADVNDCYSINIGVRAYNCDDGNTGVKASFYFDDVNGKSLVVDCDGGGKNVDYSVRGTNNTLISGMKGLNKFEGDVQIMEGCVLYV